MSTSSTSSSSFPPSLCHLRFEVFGRVQGVSFRQCTVDRARLLGLRGWVANTAEGSVKGEAVGPKVAIAQMQRFVEKEGSPQSTIDTATTDVKEDITEADHSFTHFEVRRGGG